MLTLDANGGGVPLIKYSRSQGLADKALISANVHTYDGPTAWRYDQENKSVDSLKQATEKDAPAALVSALRTGIGKKILEEGMSHFIGWKDQNPRAKCLVVCTSIEEARNHQRSLTLNGFESQIATSEDSKAAADAIRSFRTSEHCNVLVTVGMAYEGLNVPAVDHVILLTRIRSAPWLAQCLARATRFDRNGRPWDEQTAHIFCPDDLTLQKALEEMGMEQVIIIPEPIESKERASAGSSSNGNVIPLSSEVAYRRSLDLDTRREIEAIRIEESLASVGVTLTEEQVGQLLGQTDLPNLLPIPITPAMEQRGLRKRIEQMVRELARHYQMEPRELNKIIKNEFGKSRRDMTVADLDAVVLWLDGWQGPGDG